MPLAAIAGEEQPCSWLAACGGEWEHVHSSNMTHAFEHSMHHVLVTSICGITSQVACQVYLFAP